MEKLSIFAEGNNSEAVKGSLASTSNGRRTRARAKATIGEDQKMGGREILFGNQMDEQIGNRDFKGPSNSSPN